MFSRTAQIRHTRILDLRKKIQFGWDMDRLMSFCINSLGVSKQTATSYIDEAAEPFRKKFQEAKNESKT